MAWAQGRPAMCLCITAQGPGRKPASSWACPVVVWGCANQGMVSSPLLDSNLSVARGQGQLSMGRTCPPLRVFLFLFGRGEAPPPPAPRRFPLPHPPTHNSTPQTQQTRPLTWHLGVCGSFFPSRNEKKAAAGRPLPCPPATPGPHPHEKETSRKADLTTTTRYVPRARENARR